MPVAVFDMLGTFFSFDEVIAAVGSTFPNLPAPPSSVFYIWMWSSLRDYFSCSHAGRYVSLMPILRASLPRTLLFYNVTFEQPQVDTVLQAFNRLKPEVGAAEAAKRLVDAGWEVWGLTNGGKNFTKELLRAAGLLEVFGGDGNGLRVMSCDDIGYSKPHPKVYSEFVTEVVHRSREIKNSYMIATHAWDLNGARNCGMRTVFLSLEEKIYLDGEVFGKPPDVTGDSMEECIDRMMTLERRKSSVSWEGAAHGRALPRELLDKID